MTKEPDMPIKGRAKAAEADPQTKLGAPAAVDQVEEKILRRIPVEVIIAAAVLGFGTAILFGPLTGLFFFAGGALATLGFLWLKSSLTRVLQGGKAAALRMGILFYLGRFVLILGVFLIIIFFYPRRLLAFAAGFSTVIPVFLVETVRALAQMKTWKD